VLAQLKAGMAALLVGEPARQWARTWVLLRMQSIAIMLHWLAQAQSKAGVGTALAQSLHLSLVLPRVVFSLSLFGLVAQAFALRAASFRSLPLHVSLLLVYPFLLLIGPASPPVLMFALFQVAFLYQVSQRSCASYLWLVVTISSLSMSWFFATGHESAFNKLHYASPFVGFDEFGYYRGAFMMGANTFGVFVLAVPLLAAFAAVNNDTKNANAFMLNAFAFCQALRAVVMVGFVAAERRHLMVWAIFAPKFVFDCCSLFVVQAACLATLKFAANL
jgi:phosphatidylinositol glycan class O